MTDKETAAKNVSELQKIFIGSFAVYGTALGSLREGDVIEHDPDTDIGMLSNDFRWEFLTEAIQKGFTILAIFGMRHYGLEIAIRRGGVKTDIMLFYQSEDGFGVFNVLWNNGGRNGIKDGIVHDYPAYLIEPETGKLGNYKIKTLGEEYVKHVYGNDWRVPIKEWDWRTDHKCRRI